jgi:hypothetical protein
MSRDGSSKSVSTGLPNVARASSELPNGVVDCTCREEGRACALDFVPVMTIIVNSDLLTGHPKKTALLGESVPKYE